MSNSEYLRIFKGLVDAVEHLNGDIGADHAVIRARIQEQNVDPDDNVAWTEMKATVREEYLAMEFFVKADVKRFGALIANTQNDFVSGQDKYPKDMSKAYDMLVNYVNPSKHPDSEAQDGGMSFYQDEETARGSRGGRGGRGRGRASGRGRGRGGRGQHADNANDDNGDDNHAIDEEQYEIGGSGNNNNDAEHRYPDCSFNVCDAEKLVLQHDGLPNKWLLLDSCSTTDIVSTADLLTDIHPASNPTWVRCNAGRVQLTMQGYLGDYPYPVWYNAKGVANILSLNNVTEHYRVTMDTADSKALVVHRCDGSTIVFTPSANGLYKHELSSSGSINKTWSMLVGVADKAMNYSKRAYKKAVMARKIQNIIMRPSTRKYKDVVTKYLRNCPVTTADIEAAEDIFGPNIGSLKGKTVRRLAEHVRTGIAAVPSEVLNLTDK